MVHVRQEVLDGRGRPRHLERDVEALDHAEVLLRLLQRATRGDVDHEVGPGRLRQGQPLGEQVGDADPPSAGVPHDRGGHDADRPGAGDEDVLADDRPLQRGVRRVAERVEERAEVRVEVGRLHPRVRRRDDDVVGEGPVAVDADPDRADAQVAPPRPAVAALPAHDVPLPGHPVTDRDLVDVGAHLDDLAEELVAQRQAVPAPSQRPSRPTARGARPCRTGRPAAP